MDPDLEFREWILQEGDRWDALKYAVKKGFNAYAKKRNEQKQKTEEANLRNKVLNTKGKAEEVAIDSMVQKGYTLSSSGELSKLSGKPDAGNNFKKWMMECRKALPV